MTPYILLNHEHPAACATALADLALVRRFMETLPEPAFQPSLLGRPGTGLADPHHPPAWSCHALARAAKKALPLELDWVVRDGNFGTRGHDHSWLEHTLMEPFSDNYRMYDGFILDVYPWTSLSGPVLVSGDWRCPWQDLYRPQPDRHDPARLDTYGAEADAAVKMWRHAAMERR